MTSDGTTTATVLAAAIVREMLRRSRDLKRGVESDGAATAKVVSEIGRLPPTTTRPPYGGDREVHACREHEKHYAELGQEPGFGTFRESI
ncbi:hypothetical protein [Bradyrhizobium sp. OAE829]|uniref:hypothetical protein n=1 Tax=Bradyrhizobium sp. OAE829 TaxID=2663807 RepID=UPI00178A8E0A